MSSLAGECRLGQPFSIAERFRKAHSNGSFRIFSKKLIFFFLQMTSVNSNLDKLTVSGRNQT